MTKDEFQEIHGFDNQDMSRIADLRRIFGAILPCRVWNASESRWCPKNGGNHGI